MMKKFLIATLVALSLTSTVAFAAINGDRFEGNDTNHQTHKHENLKMYKIDPVEKSSTYIIEEKIQITTDLENKIVDVKILDDKANVEFVHLKGGNAFNCYNFEGEPLSRKDDEATGLMCPSFQKDNKPEDKYTEYPEISHITIYYKIDDDLPETGGTDSFLVILGALGTIAGGIGIYGKKK